MGGVLNCMISLIKLKDVCFLLFPQCITNFDRDNGYNSSLQLPDATLNFAKKHPLMEDRAEARPLLLTKGINFTRLAVDRVSSLDQRPYSVLFIGTGMLLKANTVMDSRVNSDSSVSFSRGSLCLFLHTC